jgi:hypothetical protein
VQQQVDHVSHVCFIYRKENFATAVQQFAAALGISDWDGPQELPYFGVLQTQSVSAGIEILAPLQDGTVFDEYLRTRGEGFFALIYGVANVRKAAAEAEARGILPIVGEDGAPVFIDAMRINHGGPAYADWKNRIRTYQEIPLQPISGVNIYLGQIEPLQQD